MSPNQDAATSGPPRGRFTIVFLIHEAFRRDIARLSSALRSSPLESTKARQLGTHWDFVRQQLHHHHRVEDESLWPLVRPKLGGQHDELAVLDAMEDQHRTLEPTCVAIDEGFVQLTPSPDASAGAALAQQLDALGVSLAAHLDAEETQCFPVIDKALSAEEFESFGKATAKAVGMRDSARFFPWIFDGADPVERQAVLSMPPPPVRILCRYVWEPRYERQVTPIWAG